MTYLCPSTLTSGGQSLLLQATISEPPERLFFSLALGTGLRLAEIAPVRPSLGADLRGGGSLKLSVDFWPVRRNTTGSTSRSPAMHGSPRSMTFSTSATQWRERTCSEAVSRWSLTNACFLEIRNGIVTMLESLVGFMDHRMT